MEPFFINSVSGNIFGLYHSAAPHADNKGNILFIPPFAEELNRSRHMISRQARRFAEAGYGVLILDLFGTGDSEGTLEQASINIWQKDILGAISWLAGKSDRPPLLWAMRSGALIAVDLVRQFPELTEQMILWSPVSNGKKFITQFLRLKLAAEITGKSSASKTSTKDLWERLESGNTLEIAGYPLSPELAYGFSSLSLSTIKLPRSVSVTWIDISHSEPASLSPASRNLIDGWKADDINVSATAVNDVSFWTLQEPEWAHSYIEQTLACLKK